MKCSVKIVYVFLFSYAAVQLHIMKCSVKIVYVFLFDYCFWSSFDVVVLLFSRSKTM